MAPTLLCLLDVFQLSTAIKESFNNVLSMVSNIQSTPYYRIHKKSLMFCTQGEYCTSQHIDDKAYTFLQAGEIFNSHVRLFDADECYDTHVDLFIGIASENRSRTSKCDRMMQYVRQYDGDFIIVLLNQMENEIFVFTSTWSQILYAGFDTVGRMVLSTDVKFLSGLNIVCYEHITDGVYFHQNNYTFDYLNSMRRHPDMFMFNDPYENAHYLYNRTQIHMENIRAYNIVSDLGVIIAHASIDVLLYIQCLLVTTSSIRITLHLLDSSMYSIFTGLSEQFEQLQIQVCNPCTTAQVADATYDILTDLGIVDFNTYMSVLETVICMPRTHTHDSLVYLSECSDMKAMSSYWARKGVCFIDPFTFRLKHLVEKDKLKMCTLMYKNDISIFANEHVPSQNIKDVVTGLVSNTARTHHLPDYFNHKQLFLKFMTPENYPRRVDI